MLKLATRLALGLGAIAIFGCNVPGQVGLGSLDLQVLAVTDRDAETGNVTHKTVLDWPPALNARNYEVIRKFGDNNAKVIATIGNDDYTDTTVGEGQTFTYTVRALSGENKELTVSNPKTVTVLAQEVGVPDGLEPANNGVVGIGETPNFKWNGVQKANWYYVTVTNQQNRDRVWSALTQDTSLKFGADSPLKLDRFAGQFPVGKQSDITQGVVYTWHVEAIRGDTTDLKSVSAVDVSPSTAMTFHQGS